MPVASRQSSWLRGEVDAACGPFFVSPTSLPWLERWCLGQANQLGDLEPFVAYQLHAIHDALRSENGSEISSEKNSELTSQNGTTPGASINAVILRDLATEPTLSARRLADRLQLSQRAVEKHLAALHQKGRLLRHGSPRGGTWQGL